MTNNQKRTQSHADLPVPLSPVSSTSQLNCASSAASVFGLEESTMMEVRGKTPVASWVREHMRIRNKFITEPLAEFLGTFVLCLFGVGASAQYTLMPNESYLMPLLGSVAGLMISIVAFGGASGSHVNPVVTLCLAIAGETSWLMVPYYWVAQFLGGYLGAGVAFAIYEHRLCLSGEDVCVEAVGIFSPLPATPLRTGLLDQIVTVAVLMVSVFAIIDQRNMKVHKSQVGIYFAIAVAGIGASFGVNAGAVLNPARDLSCRLMAITLGHSVDTIFYYGDEPYWLVPLLGPLIGGLLGTFIYIFCVGSHLQDEEEDLERRSMDSTDWKSMLVVPTKTGASSMSHVYGRDSYIGGPNHCPGGVNNNGYSITEESRHRITY